MGNNKSIRLGALGIVAGSIYSAIQHYRESHYTLEGKVILITGGSRGLGLVLARQLAKAGAKIAICARNQNELDLAKKELLEISADVIAINCDISQFSNLPGLIESVTGHFGGLDVLINNAGQILVSPYDSLSQKDFDKLQDIHVQAPMRLCQAVIPLFRENGGGRIVNISSVGGRVSVPHLMPYSVSKFALTGFSEGLSAALRKENILVTTVSPGLIRTGSPRNVKVKGDVEAEYRWFKISGSLPILSSNAEAAAGQIINAMRRGSPAITIGLPAYLLQVLHGLAPGLTTRIMSGINQVLLPQSIEQKKAVFGYQTEFEEEKGTLTKLTDEAAQRNNESIKEQTDIQDIIKN